VQLIAWEPEHEEEATVVTVRPNFQDSVHVGYVVGLKKFTEYLTSVLCFTTPGDGPRSPPQLVRTHEDGTGRLCAPRGGREQPGDVGLVLLVLGRMRHGVPVSPGKPYAWGARSVWGRVGSRGCVAVC